MIKSKINKALVIASFIFMGSASASALETKYFVSAGMGEVLQ